MCAAAALVVFDVAMTERLSRFFDTGFILVGVCAALVVGERGFFAVAVLPSYLLAAVVAVLAALDPATLTATRMPYTSTWLTGMAQHATPLVTTCTLVLTTLALRTALRIALGFRPRGSARHRTAGVVARPSDALPDPGGAVHRRHPSVLVRLTDSGRLDGEESLA